MGQSVRVALSSYQQLTAEGRAKSFFAKSTNSGHLIYLEYVCVFVCVGGGVGGGATWAGPTSSMYGRHWW